MPCNVVVRQEEDGQLVVAFMDPVAVLQMTTNPEVARVARMPGCVVGRGHVHGSAFCVCQVTR